jgi:HTH-type transcriptional regulator / antitoxin HipB
MLIRTPGGLGQMVRDRRNALRLSQTDLARRVGVTRQSVGALEKGIASAKIGLVLSILEALDLRVDIIPKERARAADSHAITKGDLDRIIEATVGDAR